MHNSRSDPNFLSALFSLWEWHVEAEKADQPRGMGGDGLIVSLNVTSRAAALLTVCRCPHRTPHRFQTTAGLTSPDSSHPSRRREAV